MSGLNVEALLAAITAEAPCGPDLSYDPAFQALEDVARGKPEQQFGDTIVEAVAPDWRVVHAQAFDLAARTRDLRVAVYLWRALTRQSRVLGLAQGLQLIHGLLERHWAHVFPLLDADDNNDPTMRLNALAPLADAQVHLELRALPIGSAKSGLTLRDLELALGKAQPRPGEAVRAIESIVKALEDGEAESAGSLEAMREAHRSLLAIDTLLTSRVPGQGPDLRPFAKLTQMLADAAARASGVPTAADGAVNEQPATNAAAARGAPGTITSRADALAALDRVCAWFESNEPGHPAPLLIRRAQRLMSKNFIDIIKDLVPDGIDQVHKIAGAAPE